MPEQPLITPHNKEAQTVPVHGNRDQQETTGGPSGQSSTGAKVAGQYVAIDRSQEGQDRGYSDPGARPNR